MCTDRQMCINVPSADGQQLSHLPSTSMSSVALKKSTKVTFLESTASTYEKQISGIVGPSELSDVL